MKKNFTHLFSFFLFLFSVLLRQESHAQCVDGTAVTPVAYDTTIRFPTGVTTKQVKFPKFDPEKGMVRCVKLIVTMTGIVDTVNMQNMSESDISATFTYNRSDQMTGPGLNTPLSNSFGKQYGPYTLTPFDGNFNAGTDYKTIPRDTVMKNVTERVLTDSVEISQFYGRDSVVYNYNINVSTAANMTGGNSSSMVLTSALVNFRFEYCTCPKATLPVGLKNFTVTKSSDRTVNLTWDGLNDDYNYEYDVEVSRDGNYFFKVATVNRKYTDNPRYLFAYDMGGNEYGQYYFRVRQHWINLYVRYTAIKSVEFTNPLFATTSLYPNPSTGSVGVKFVNAKAGAILVQVSNVQGQPVLTRQFQIAETSYKEIGQLPKGIYWVKLMDPLSGASCVKQLVVQ